MKKFLLFVLIVAGGTMWAKDFIRSGKFDDYLDRHPNARVNPWIEYHWGVLLNAAHRERSSHYRLNRVREKYPETAYAARAWAEIISIYDEQDDRDRVLDEGAQFLEQYPDHPKAELIRRKIHLIRNGY